MQFYSKEIQIMRQSQQKIALDFLQSHGIKVNMTQLQQVTDLFVECCLVQQHSELKERLKKFDEWIKSRKTI